MIEMHNIYPWVVRNGRAGDQVPKLQEWNQGASLPTLGLSNKAVYEGGKCIPEEERHVKDQFPDFYFSPQVKQAQRGLNSCSQFNYVERVHPS